MHKNATLRQDPLVFKKLLENEIDYVHLDIGMVDRKFQFFTPYTIKDEDWYNYDLANENIIPGYIEPEDPIQ